MNILDIIIVVLLGLMTYYGYRKGIVITIFNFVFMVLFFIIFNDQVTKVISDGITMVETNINVSNISVFLPLIIIIIGLVLMFMADGVIRKFLHVTKLSIIDKIIGAVIHFVLGYTILMFIVTLIGLSNIEHTNELINNSFFFSESFIKYNILLKVL